jgi:hypothetical protein
VAVSLDGAMVVVVVVSVVVEVVLVDEEVLLPLSLPPHAAVSVLRAITAAIPAAAESRRGIRVSVMVNAPFCVANPSGRAYPPERDVKHDGADFFRFTPASRLPGADAAWVSRWSSGHRGAPVHR